MNEAVSIPGSTRHEKGRVAEKSPAIARSEGSYDLQQGWGIVFSGLDQGGLDLQIDTLRKRLMGMEGDTSYQAANSFHQTLNLTHLQVGQSSEVQNASTAYVKFLEVREGAKGKVRKMFIANVGQTAVYLYKGEKAKPLYAPPLVRPSYLNDHVDHRSVQIVDAPEDALLILTSPEMNVLTPAQISEVVKLNRRDIEGALVQAALKATASNGLKEKPCEPVVVVLDPKTYTPAA